MVLSEWGRAFNTVLPEQLVKALQKLSIDQKAVCQAHKSKGELDGTVLGWRAQGTGLRHGDVEQRGSRREG